MNKNFETIKNKEKQEVTRLRYEFDKRGFGVNAYAKAFDLQEDEISKLFKGRIKGTRAKPDSRLRRMILLLKKDGVWIGKLPWEV